MDCDKKYIKMCEKTPLREDWQPTYGDYVAGEWYIDEEDNTGLVPFGIIRSYNQDKELIDAGGDIHWYKKAVIWLPRQDQLQEMLRYKPAYSLAWGLARGFDKFITTIYYPINYSMEQLWLVFIMQGKFNKVWNEGKEEWIKT